MRNRAVIYSRVSTLDQVSENQTIALEELADRFGWQVVGRYVDHGVSGVAPRRERPQFDQLCKDLRRRNFDIVMVWDVSRLGRSLRALLEFLNDVIETNCDLYVFQQGLDTRTAAGRAMFQMVGVFSEFEREMISERVKLGLHRARAQGKAIGRPRLNAKAVMLARKMRDAGASFADIRSETGVSRSALYRSRPAAMQL